MEHITIAPQALAIIERHLAAVYPDEGCGVLLCSAQPDGGGKIVDAAPVQNISKQKQTRYEMDPFGCAAIERKALAGGFKVAGFFHSHPDSPAIPSAIDLETAQGLFEFTRETFLYAIQTVSRSGGGELRLWRLGPDGRQFSEQPFCSPQRHGGAENRIL